MAVTGLFFQVTHCPVRAAVEVVIAAHGLMGGEKQRSPQFKPPPATKILHTILR